MFVKNSNVFDRNKRINLEVPDKKKQTSERDTVLYKTNFIFEIEGIFYTLKTSRHLREIRLIGI